MRSPVRISGELLADGIKEEFKTLDVTAGGTHTLNFANGLKVSADDTIFTLAKGAFNESLMSSMLVYVSAAAGVGAITWSGWNFVNTGDEPDGSGITTYGLYEILAVGGDFFIFTVKEG